MANYIEKNFINAFRSGFAQAFQQSDSRFRSTVEHETQNAEFEYYDRIGLADDMQVVTTRYGDNPINEIDHGRRQISTKDYELGKPVDEKDLLRVATDPSHAYTQAMVASANRKIDDIIVTGFTAPSFTGKSGGTQIDFVGTTAGKVTIGQVSNTNNNVVNGTLAAVTPGNVEGIDVAVDYTGAVAANAGLTKEKLKVVRQFFGHTEALDPKSDEVITMIISPKQVNDLLSITELISSDYNTVKPLAEGKVVTWMGYRFIVSNRLPLVGSSRACFAYLPKCFKLAMAKDAKVDMWRLTGQKNIPYIYLAMSMGGTRMWGECLAKVNCFEA